MSDEDQLAEGAAVSAGDGEDLGRDGDQLRGEGGPGLGGHGVALAAAGHGQPHRGRDHGGQRVVEAHTEPGAGAGLGEGALQ